jgi:hypothetical protein
MMHKIRESLLVQRDESASSGEAQFGGAFTNGSVRPDNRAEERVDLRIAE